MAKKKIYIVCEDHFYSSKENKNVKNSANMLKEMILQSTEKGRSVFDITNGEFECECVDDTEFTHYVDKSEVYKVIFLGRPSTISGGKFSNCEKCADFERAYINDEFRKSQSEHIDYGWDGNCAYIKSVKSLFKSFYGEYDDDIDKLSKLFYVHYKEVCKYIKENNLSLDENLVVSKDLKLKPEKSKHILRRSVMGGLALAAPPIATSLLFFEGMNMLVTDNITKLLKKKSNRSSIYNGIFELRVLYFYLAGLKDFLYSSEKTVDNSDYSSAENVQELYDMNIQQIEISK